MYYLFFIVTVGLWFNFNCFSTELNQFQISFIIQRGAILVKDNGENPSTYLLDTGVSIPVIKDEKNNDNVMSKNFIAGIPFLPNYPGKSMTSDLTDISKKIGVHIDGILPIYYPGYEIYLDFGKGKIIWQLISVQKKLRTKDIFCEKIYFSTESIMPKLPLTLNDKIAVMGNIDLVRGEYIVFPMNLVNERGLLRGESRFVHFRNKKVIQYFRLNTLKLGNQRFNNLLSVSVPEEKEISLGTSFWRQFVIRMSYEEASICFLKTNPPKEQEWVGVGIVPDYFDEWGWVIGVIEDSSAWENNLRGGETLIKINEWEVKNLNPDQIVHLLNPPVGTQVVCEVLDVSRTPRTLNLFSQKLL